PVQPCWVNSTDRVASRIGVYVAAPRKPYRVLADEPPLPRVVPPRPVIYQPRRLVLFPAGESIPRETAPRTIAERVVLLSLRHPPRCIGQGDVAAQMVTQEVPRPRRRRLPQLIINARAIDVVHCGCAWVVVPHNVQAVVQEGRCAAAIGPARP